MPSSCTSLLQLPPRAMSRKGLVGTQNNNCQMSRTQVILLPCSDHHKLFLAKGSHPETVQGNCAWDLICEFFSLNAHMCIVKISSISKQPCVRFCFLNFLRCQYNCIFEWEQQQFAISTWNKQQQCWQFSKYTPSAAREFDGCRILLWSFKQVSNYSWSQLLALSHVTNFMFLKKLLVQSLSLCLYVFCSCVLSFWGLSEHAWERRSRYFVATADR